MKKILVVVASLLLAGALLPLGSGTAAASAPRLDGTYPFDGAAARCGVASDGLLHCGNKGNIPVYTGASLSWDVSGRLLTTYSWFDCYLHGDPHSGGNDVWYHTKGDRAEYPYDGWGYVPAVNVYSPTDPMPGLDRCIHD